MVSGKTKNFKIPKETQEPKGPKVKLGERRRVLTPGKGNRTKIQENT